MDPQNFSTAASEPNSTAAGSRGALFLLGLRVSLSVAMAALALAAALSNAFVVAAICLGANLRTPANGLIGSLAVADLLVALLVMPVGNAYTALRTWPLGQVACDVWVALDVTLCTASIVHLCAIALDRYWAVTRAVWYAGRRTPLRAGLAIASAWGVSLCVSVPPLFWRRAREALGECAVDHGVYYSVYATCGSFFVPGVAVVILYAKIYSAARSRIRRPPSTVSPSSSAPAQQPEPSSLSQRSVSSTSQDSHPHGAKQPAAQSLKKKRISVARERKATKTLGLILGAFIFCWLPFFTTVLVLDVCGDGCWSHPVLVDVFTWLGYLNSLVNPVIYTYFNRDFKRAFHRLVYSKRCWR